ncbi:MAG: twin-arginine translocase subunit TatC [Gammaproteobacteria bacterium]|nr:twin-arginine translocase subunit TatC [Gammaproteobacteria bacterium]
MTQSQNKNTTHRNPEIIRFLTELRSRLINACIVLLLLAAVLLYFANDLYHFLALPLLRYIPQGHLIATQIVSPFFVPFKLALLTATLISMPYFLYQIWAFITPALYGVERRLVGPFLLASIVLFYAGIVFSYTVIFPMLFHFLAQVAPVGVQLSPDIGEYLDFTIKLLLVFGVLFEIPMMMCLLVLLRVTTREKLKKMRPYALVGAFIIGMLFSPPDVISQTILAIPIWLLYELGLFFTRFVKQEEQVQDSEVL